MSDFDDDTGFDDLDFEQALNEEEKQQEEEDDFGDDFGDDLDLEELVEVSESVEQQHAANNGVNISFVPPNDPTPPPALPESTRSFHPLDVENLRTWIYPTNYPVRGYQLNIVQKAMFNNTLVALPTGLGKTFIAAVVMFNYWRWFPNSLIIFMAPTRPLVTQQIEACFRICGLPQSETCDISGTTQPAKRRELYKTKRVFFATPQTINNDLKSKSCPAEKIVCLVIDEAHKATGNYAYCGVIKKVSSKHKDFRVLALTATPGSRLETVQNVVDNLKISHIQIRTEESMDIREFSHGKNIQSIIVRLSYTEGSTGILPKIIEEFKAEVFEPCIKAILSTPAGGSIPSNVDSVTTYGLTAARQRFTVSANNINNGLKFKIIKQILVAEQMSRAYDLLCQHGIYPFLETIEQHRQEFEEERSSGKKASQASENYYNNSYINRVIPYLKREMAKPDFMGHPKMDQLVAILLKHFTDLPQGTASKVMIFSSFRSSVTEICKVLDRHNPLIRCSHFVGQSDGKNGLKGLKQSEQQEVIKKFKRDEFNVLVATSIGEEGLDIGEVDLIVCYDSQASPIRMLQRMGRAGRKRQGKCYMIMTELERKKFDQAKEAYARVQKLITQGTYLSYHRPNPVIIPSNYRPTICRKELTIGRYEQTEIKKKRRTASSSVASNVNADGIMNEATERQFLQSLCDDANYFTNISQAMSRYWPYKPGIQSLNRYVPFQTTAKPTYRVANSHRTTQFVQLVERMENRILYPEQEMQPTLPSNTIPAKTQTTLKMPSKASSILKMPRRKKTTQAEALDDAFADFMEQNDVSHFLNNDVASDDDLQLPEPSSRRVILDDFFAPKRKEKKKLVQRSSPSPPPPSLRNSTEDMIVDDLPDIPTSPRNKGKQKAIAESSKPIVSPFDISPPRHEEKEIMSDINMIDAPTATSRDKGKRKMTASEERSFMFDDNFDESMDDASMVHNPILPESIFEDAVPFQNNPVSTTELKLGGKFKQTADNNVSPPKEEIMEIDMDELHDAVDDDFGDSVFDDAFLAAENQALAVSSAKGFDDVLPPKFSFERENNDQHIDHVAFIWTQPTPTFSDKAYKLLEKRQETIKESTGKFVAMNIYAKFKFNNQAIIDEKRNSSPIIISSQPLLKQEANLSQDFDDDFGFESEFLEQAIALEQNLQRNQEQKEVPIIIIQSPVQKVDLFEDELEKNPEEQVEENNSDEEEGFEGFSDINFNELSFTNLIENKMSDDEAGYHQFMHEEEYNYASQQASQMKERRSFYSHDSPNNTAVNTSTHEPSVAKSPVASVVEEVFEIDFDNTPTPPAAAAVEEEVVYEYDFNSSSDEERNISQPKEKTTAETSPSPPFSPNATHKATPIHDSSNRVKISTPLNNSQDDDFEPLKTPIAQKSHYSIASPVKENDKMRPSPNRLLQMSKGLTPTVAFSPISVSPLRNSPLKGTPLQNSIAEDSDESPNMPIRRRKRRMIEVSPMDVEDVRPSSKPKKRLKRKPSTPLSSPPDGNTSVVEISNDEEDDDDDLVVFAPPSKNLLLQRLEQCKEDTPKQHIKQRRIKQSINDLAGNPFMDVEAERSSDEGHTSDDEDGEGGSSILNSFIDDESLDPGSRISIDDEEDQDSNGNIQKKKKKVNMYVQSMMNDDMVSNNSKHWMNRFDANKWLNAGEDSIIEEDTESYGGEEGEEQEDRESVTEFSSHLGPVNDDPIYTVDDDEDFM